MIIYDITNKNSFDSIEKRFNDLISSSDKEITIIIIGNKSDLENKRQVSKEQGEIKARELNAGFLEISAFSGKNIDKAFEMLLNEIFRKEFFKEIKEININIIHERKEKEEDENEDENNKEIILELNKKCSLKEHNETDAIIYCQECKIYMCRKCENLHLGLFKNHHSYKLDNDINNIFTGICKQKNHSMSLDYFCKTHNKLCCAACIAKIKGLGNGFHNNCVVRFIKNIKNEKKDKLSENIKYLEDIWKNLENSIKELKIIYEKINKKKEELKLNIQTVFTKLRNIINEREDNLLLEVDNKFNELFFKEELIKESEKLPNQIKLNLEKGKSIINDKNSWEDNNKLNFLINDCINIEKNIKDINKINENIIKNTSLKNFQIEFNPFKDD